MKVVQPLVPITRKITKAGRNQWLEEKEQRLHKTYRFFGCLFRSIYLESTRCQALCLGVGAQRGRRDNFSSGGIYILTVMLMDN